jgi:acyl-coenzyme A synthetase/AMP-(fatty) acid ligase/acyl carrier protein
VQGLRRLVSSRCRIFNGYGPTETTVNCLAYEIPTASDDGLPDIIPVGRTTGAARVAIVDSHGRPVPVGAVGELLIGGPGVADGYLGRPEESAERFTPDPSGQLAGMVYRSGDRAYLRSDGQIVILGRSDRQTKVRGFRIELGEIEHLLRSEPAVTAAVVGIVPDPARLVAFVQGHSLDADRLRSMLADHLVPATVPDQIVLVEVLPTTANGKADQEALNELAQRDHVPTVSSTASLAEIEIAVCEVWRRQLQVSQVSPDESVFDLGAHSLIVPSIHFQLERTLGIQFPVHEIFSHPRPGDLARHLAHYRRGNLVGKNEKETR